MVGAHCHRCSWFAAVYVNVDESEIERKRERVSESEKERERDEASERAHGAGHNGN